MLILGNGRRGCKGTRACGFASANSCIPPRRRALRYVGRSHRKLPRCRFMSATRGVSSISRKSIARPTCTFPPTTPTDTSSIRGIGGSTTNCWSPNRRGCECGLHGTAPARYPVFCKPVTNLKGMGAGSCVLQNESDYREKCKPGDFWMKLMTGEHVSTDWAVVRGETAWCRHTLGIPGVAGTFDYWVIQARGRPGLGKYCRGLDHGVSARLHRHAQHRDHRRADHRGAPAFCRPVARPLWATMAERRGAALQHQQPGILAIPNAPTAIASCCSGRTACRYRASRAEDAERVPRRRPV